MNTNYNGVSELSADDLDSVSGGNRVVTVPVGLVQKVLEERAQMQAIGIEKGKPFNPDEKTKGLLSEAARIGCRAAYRLWQIKQQGKKSHYQRCLTWIKASVRRPPTMSQCI